MERLSSARFLTGLLISVSGATLAAQEPSAFPADAGSPLGPPGPGALLLGVLGDFGTTEPESFAVAQLVRAVRPELLITLGDNNYPDGAAATIDANIGQHYREWIAPYRGIYGPG